MKINKLELNNFRIFNNIKIENLEKINIIIGSNGIGKTSILESIYIGSLTKSFKNCEEKQLLNINSKIASIKIETQDKSNKMNLKIIYDDMGKRVYINNNIIKKLSEYIGGYKVILFSPDELKIIKGSPNIRRNYLNIEISQLNKVYLKKLNEYNNLIKNKNDYLKKIYLNNNIDSKYLDILDLKISELGYYIFLERKNYIDNINNFINDIFCKFRKKNHILLKYESDFKNMNIEEINNLLKKERKKEMNFGLTSTGIHRDEIIFLYNNIPAREFCSQGIQKLIVLSMKLAEIELLCSKYKINPILLLDDLFSELDKKNQNRIFLSLNKKLQIIITTTDINNLNKKVVQKSKIINIEKMVK